MSTQLSDKNIIILYAALSVAYLSGLFVPLMENDAAQHASMAMRMALNDDYLHIYKGNEPYLDKPHLHFWLAAWSMNLFGINHVAYRIPALLFLAIAAWCTYKLTVTLYRDRKMAHVAALMFLSAQTIILSAHDVRTDAVLTGAVIFGVYHLVAYIKNGTGAHILLGGLGAAMALGAKGMVGVGIIGVCVLSYLLYSREWQRFFRWKLLLGLLSFIIGIAPFVYAYYQQFDQHPEMLVRGEYGVSGVRFILWDQSFKRFSGEDFGANSPDYLFFFHSLLWVFIPFSVPMYGGVFNRTWYFIKNRFAKVDGSEFLTVGGFWMIMLIFSFSKFKLPHYLNSLIPIIAILTAAYLFQLGKQAAGRTTKVYLWFGYLLIGIGLALMVYLGGLAFGIPSGIGFLLVVGAGVLLVRAIWSDDTRVPRIIAMGVYFVAMLNIFLNTQFYPALTHYQAGLQMAKQIQEKGISPKDIVMPDYYANWTLDFYTKTNIQRLPMDVILQEKGKYLFISEPDLEQWKAAGRSHEIIAEASHYRITRLKPAFLNAKTRNSQLSRYLLVKAI
ncbi:ArnT family glycosyltransferase [Parapedobacter koreensis]|uniref:4-amino-4-deoxy-L-arabinose transferase n=1 Tax=Parapedobacter koreensis TaxID=332977 RepID=A0A1H7LD22_9SPHI|nr:glycosyltransferase family 39 protein [Parapedobacter koreensis]SEK96746.1 4-amino-4-deoxy-L-arabinose transferase [Parapedobacter koreensis]